MVIHQTHNLWNFREDIILLTWIVVNLVWIIPKKRNKIKDRSIICSYIWYVNKSKYAYWLDTHSVKVWWRYVLPNTNAVHFCDIFSDIGQYFWSAQTRSFGIKKIRLGNMVLNKKNSWALFLTPLCNFSWMESKTTMLHISRLWLILIKAINKLLLFDCWAKYTSFNQMFMVMVMIMIISWCIARDIICI